MAESFEKIGQVSSASVKKATGKDWNTWVQTLDRAGARLWTYKEIVAFIKKKFKLTIWWQGNVAIGYEIAIGRRIVGRNSKGEYTAGVSKTFPLGSKALWRFLASDSGQAIWLRPLSDFDLKTGNVFETEDGFFGEVRTMRAGERVRFKWQDIEWEKHSVLQFAIIPRNEKKSVLVISHEKLGTARIKEEMHARWTRVLNALHSASQKRA